MINLYKKDETTFEHNGLGSLDNNILNQEISWKDNGAFTLEFKYPLFAKHGFEIENSSIIRANDPEGSNLFFVYKITPSMGYVTVLCYQISYKLAFNSINDTNIVNKNGQNALNQMSSATQYPHGFTFNSDISTTATSRVVRKNPIEFLLDTGLDNSFINRWGGHIVRHNFNISMNSAYGSNKGYTIRHRKDLIGYEAEFDESTVITRIRPVGYDGLLLPEIYVDSPLINTYTEPRIQQFEYSDVKVKQKDDDEGFATKEKAYAELRRLAQLEFSKNKVDKPDFSAKVEFVNLKETQEYQDLRSLKQLLPGDIVKVIHADDNFNIQAQMVEYKWNPLNNSYISITLGNYTKSFTSTVSKASSLQTNLSQIAQQAQSAMTAANGKNTVYSLTYKPPITASSVEGDLLYLKNGDKIEMWILELVDGKLQWVLQVSDATSEELKAQMQQAQNDITDAVDSANNAVDKANASVTAVQAAKIDIDKALNDSTSALDAIKVVDGRVDSVTTTIANVKVDVDKKADKTIVASQISQSATQVNQDVQTWTNNKLTSYSTTQQTTDSITNAVANKADKSQVTQLSNQITSTVTGSTNESIVTVDMIKNANTKHPDYPDMIVLGIPATSGETYIVSTNKPNRGTESDPIADVFYTKAWNALPSSQSNGAWSGHSVTTKAVINRIYLVFRDANFLNSFANGEYWVKVISAPASQSQITQLASDINLRVSKGDVTSQINIESGRTLIDTKQLLLSADTVKFTGSAFIPDAMIKSLTADKIIAGTINAATVNIININAASITTGTLNADRIGANSITADKIKATSIDLFNNDSYTNVKADGMRIQSKAHIIFGPWIDINGNRKSTQGIYIGGFGGGTKHVALTRSNGTTFLLRAEDGMDYGANKNVSIGDLNLYDSVQFWESARVHGNLINEGYIAMGGGIQEASIQYDKPAGTMNFRVPGARSGSYFWFNQRAISEGSFDSKSKLSLKNVKGAYLGNALDDIVSTDIVEYSYKNDPKRRQLSPIIDDINKIKKYTLPDIINDGESVNLYAMGSLSWLAIKQLAQKLENIEEKLDAIA